MNSLDLISIIVKSCSAIHLPLLEDTHQSTQYMGFCLDSKILIVNLNVNFALYKFTMIISCALC